MLARAACVRERALVRFFLGAREDGSCLPACLPRRPTRGNGKKSFVLSARRNYLGEFSQIARIDIQHFFPLSRVRSSGHKRK